MNKHDNVIVNDLAVDVWMMRFMGNEFAVTPSTNSWIMIVVSDKKVSDLVITPSINWWDMLVLDKKVTDLVVNPSLKYGY